MKNDLSKSDTSQNVIADTKKGTTVALDFPITDIVLFERLSDHLKHDNRFNLEGQFAAFVSAIINYAKKHAKTVIPQGTKFYRSRLHPNHSSHDSEPLQSNELQAPPREKARAGRLNPEGIPYLYLADVKYTAVAEVRPWVGAKITVAEFEILHDLSVVDTMSKKIIGYQYGPSDELPPSGQEFSWRELVSSAFSTPYRPQESVGYVPTQYLAERFKANGFQGVLYGSSLNPDGHNLAIFDPAHANQLSRQLVEVKKVSYEFKNIPPKRCRSPFT